MSKEKFGGTYQCLNCRDRHIDGIPCNKVNSPLQLQHFMDCIEYIDSLLNNMHMTNKTRISVKLVLNKLKSNEQVARKEALKRLVELIDDFSLTKTESEELSEKIKHLESNISF